MNDSFFLKIEGISKSFGALRVLDNINLNISKSEFFGLLGASGSGKTTLLRILGGFEKPDSGKIFLDGHDITNLESFERPLNYLPTYGSVLFFYILYLLKFALLLSIALLLPSH